MNYYQTASANRNLLLWSCTFQHIPSQNYNHSESRNTAPLMEMCLWCFNKQNFSYSPDKYIQTTERKVMCASFSLFKWCAEKQWWETCSREERHSFTPPHLLLLPRQAEPAEIWLSTAKSWILLLSCNIQWPLDCENSQLPLSKSWGPAAYGWSLLINLRKKLGLPK